MAGLNKVMLIGNVCKDPEIRAIDNGTKVASLSLATNESYTTKDGKKVENTEFHKLVFWRNLADICDRFVKTGNQIYIEGKIKTRKWVDKKTGENKYMTEIICDQLLLLGGKKGVNNGDDKGVDNKGFDPTVPQPEDDLPF